MNISKELLDHFGVKAMEVLFTKPKRVIIRYVDEKINDNIKDNVLSIDIMDSPIGTAIGVNYETEGGTGAISSAMKNIKEVLVVD